MSYSWKTLAKAEALWKEGKDDEANNSMLLAAQEATDDAVKMREYGQLLLRMRRIWALVTSFRQAIDRFANDHMLADLLIDVFFQIGDAESALETYSLALSHGLPPHSHAIRRVTRVAIICGKLDELQSVLVACDSSQYKAESLAILANERIAYDRLELQRTKDLGNAAPSASEIRRAVLAGDLQYASHLYTVAAGSASIAEMDLLDIAYNTHPPSGNESVKLSFMGWRLLKRLNGSSPAKLFAAAFCLLPRGDVYGANLLLEEALGGLDLDQFPTTADLALRLTTSCSVFGALPQCRILEISGALWNALRRKEYSILAAGFAARSNRSPVVRLPSSNRPRIAVCVSGQLRGYARSWPETRASLEGMDVTYFVFTWDNTGAGFGVGDSITRKLPEAVRDTIASGFQTKDFFSTRYPNTFDRLNEATKITTAECSKFFGTPFAQVDDEDEFDARYSSFLTLRRSGSINQAKMYYGIHKAIEMKNIHEAAMGMRFDAVIRIRPDLAVKRVASSDIVIAAGGTQL